MCYELCLSTTSPLDLSTLNSSEAFFEPIDEEGNKQNLNYDFKYRLATGAPGCCSCYFRIFEEDMISELSFEQLKDWYKEEPNDMSVKNTIWLLNIIKTLIEAGYRVDTYVAQGYMFHDPITKKRVIRVDKSDIDNFAFVECVYYDYQK